MSPAERYKGGFLRTLKQAKDLYASIPDSEKSYTEAIALLDAINMFETLVSTSPSVYEHATKALMEAMENAASLSGVEAIPGESMIVGRDWFNIHGQAVGPNEKGILIERVTYRDGKTEIFKKLTR